MKRVLASALCLPAVLSSAFAAGSFESVDQRSRGVPYSPKIELAAQQCWYVTDQVICGQDCATRYVVQGGVSIPVRDCRPRYCAQSRRVCQ